MQARITASTLNLLSVAARLAGVDLAGKLNAMIATRNPPRRHTRGLTVRHGQFNGWALCTLQSKSPSHRHVLAIHGGTFVCEPTPLHWHDYAAIARHSQAIVVVVLYPLAPRGTAGTVVPKMADLITSLIGEHGSHNVSIYGDSAGGGIALAAVQELVRRNASIPARMVLLSPVLDATLSNPDIQFVNDPVLRAEVIKTKFKLWAADLELTDPRVSPLHGSLSGLPPTAVYAGSRDLLGPDAVALQYKALATHGAKFTFDLRSGEIHGWPMSSLPEARGALPDPLPAPRLVSGRRGALTARPQRDC